MRKPLIFSVTFLAGVGSGILLWQQFVTARLTAENKRLQAEAQSAAALAEENSRLQAEHVDAAEIKRLRDGQAELLRLRGQTAQLRREANDAKAAVAHAARLAEQQAKAATALAQPTNDSPVETFAAGFSVSVPWQLTAVAGGWEINPGKRTFLMIAPSQEADNNIAIQTQVVEMPDNVLAENGLSSITSNGKATGSAILSPDRLQKLIETEGVSIVSRPRVLLNDGAQGQIGVNFPSEHNDKPGLTVDFIPKTTPDKQGVEIAVGTQVKVPRKSTY